TIKGTSGFLAFNRLEKLTHTGESLLARLRDGHQRMTTPTADALLAMVDTVRALLGSIEATGTEGEVQIESVMEQIRAQVTDGSKPAPAPSAAAPSGIADAAASKAASEPSGPDRADAPADAAEAADNAPTPERAAAPPAPPA